MEDQGWAAALVILGILAGCVFLGWAIAKNDFQKEAVKAGVAHWVVDASGDTTFVFNSPTAEAVK